MKLSQSPARVTAKFDDTHLVGYAGLVPAMRLAETIGLFDLVDHHVRLPGATGANPGVKIGSLIAGMLAGADSIDDMDRIRHGGMPQLFTGMRAPSTLGSFLRSFTFGHTRQVDAVASRLLAQLDEHTEMFGSVDDSPVMIDIDDTIVEVFGATKQGAVFGRKKKVRGLSALLITASAEDFSPIIIGQRLRAGSAHSVRGAHHLVRETLQHLCHTSVAGRQLWLRADSGFYTRDIVGVLRDAQGWVSITVRKTTAEKNAIAAIPDHQWTPLLDSDTKEPLIGEVAETPFTAFSTTTTPLPCRLIIHREPDPTEKQPHHQDGLFPLWKYHAFITNAPPTYDAATLTVIHRRHAIIEQVNSALKDSALAHLPSASFPANTVWLTLAAITFNLLRALASLTHDTTLTRATPATLRQRLIHVPARIATRARTTFLHLPHNWRWATAWLTLFTNTHPPPRR
ncbi:MAG: IS1380 family transposase [Propionibacteriaceae bacterium]|nr:IS1380 family transposase [Propionibacteriaceae bacterium]